MLNTWVRNECDPAYALLYDSVSKENAAVRIGAIQGLGLAYAGTAKEDVAELLCPLVCDEANNADVFGFAALTLGLVFVGTAHPGCTEVRPRTTTCQTPHRLSLLIMSRPCLVGGLWTQKEIVREVSLLYS